MKKTNGGSGKVANAVKLGSALVPPVVGSGPVASPTSGSGSTTSAGGATLATSTGEAATGFRQKLQLMLAGVQAVLPDGSSIGSINGPTMAKADIVTELSGGLAEYSAVDTAVAASKQTRVQLQGDLPGLKSYYAALEVALRAQFGPSNPQLTQFGLKPKAARKQLTPAQILVRTAKAEQTRAIRGTTSKKQKAALQFQGQVSVSTALSGGAAAAPAAGSTAQAAASQGQAGVVSGAVSPSTTAQNSASPSTMVGNSGPPGKSE